MKKIYVLLLLGLCQFTGFSQASLKKIEISKDLELIELSENAYVHISYFDMPSYGRTAKNGLIFINRKEAFIFDSPWTDSLTEALFSCLRDSMKLKIVGFIPNHWHKDCMGGLRYILNQKIETFANQMTIDIAKSKNLPLLEHGFLDSLILQLGDKTIFCYYPGAAHSMDNIVVWIPSERILFAGCMAKSLASKDLGNTTDGDLHAYSHTIDKVINKFPQAKIVIPGHGQPGNLNLLMHTKRLLNE